MKIAYFTALYSSGGSGPARVVQYLREYKGQALNFSFFTDDKLFSIPHEVRIKKVSVLHKLPFYWFIRSYLFFLAAKRKKKEFNLIICSNAFEAFFLVLFIKETPVRVMLNDYKYIFTSSNFWKTLKINSLRKTLSRFLGFYIERLVAIKSDQVIACSYYLKEALIKSYKLKERGIQVLYPSVDLDFFTPHRRNYFQGAEINVLFVKNDWRIGGLDTIIQGLSKYKGPKKLHLHIVGPIEKDKKIIMSLLKIFDFIGALSFHGILDKRELLNRLHQADVFILLSRQEAFGISILEAQATATPVIASNVGGIPEVLDEGKAGFLIEPNSPDALHAVLNDLIQNPDLVYPKIEHGLEHCKKFSKNHLYSNLENLLYKE